MDFPGEDEGHVNAPVNLDLPEFLVIPPRLWVGKTISLHNGSGVCIAEGLVRNLLSNAIVGSAGPLGGSQVFVQVSRTFVEEEAPDEWRYSFKSWPIQQVFLEGVSLFHHSERNAYNMWFIKRSRPLGGRTRTYDNSTTNIPLPLSRNAQFLMTPRLSMRLQAILVVLKVVCSTTREQRLQFSDCACTIRPRCSSEIISNLTFTDSSTEMLRVEML